MLRLFLILTLIVVTISSISQTLFRKHLENIEGVWIENEFKNFFDQNLSMMEYARTISPANLDKTVYPIGFRFQSIEIEGEYLSIGYSFLHSHTIHPEVSIYCIQQYDTLYEQGNFMINLNQKDSLGYYKIPDLISMFATSSPCFIKVNYGLDTSITFLRKSTTQTKEIMLNFKKVSSEFSEDYQFPNPRDFYVRSMTLSGAYVLKDSLNNVISSNFIINPNGSMVGYTNWEKKKIEFVTDVFCGGPPIYDKIIIYDAERINESEINLMIYERLDNGVVILYSYSIENQEPLKGSIAYTLIKK